MTWYLYRDTKSGFADLVNRPVIPELFPDYEFIDEFPDDAPPDLVGMVFDKTGNLVQVKHGRDVDSRREAELPSAQEQLDAIWAEMLASGPLRSDKAKAIFARVTAVIEKYKPTPPPTPTPGPNAARQPKPMPQPIVDEPIATDFLFEPPVVNPNDAGLGFDDWRQE